MSQTQRVLRQVRLVSGEEIALPFPNSDFFRDFKNGFFLSPDPNSFVGVACINGCHTFITWEKSDEDYDIKIITQSRLRNK